jgi:hypothetical protein
VLAACGRAAAGRRVLPATGCLSVRRVVLIAQVGHEFPDTIQLIEDCMFQANRCSGWFDQRPSHPKHCCRLVRLQDQS